MTIKGIKKLFFVLAIIGLSLGWGETPQAYASEDEQPIVTDSIQYVKLQPIVIPILGHDGSVQIISIAVAIEVPDSSSQDIVRTNRLRLTDAFITDMYGVLGQNRLMTNGLLNVASVKTRLSKIGKKLLGEEVITGVLLESVQQRRV